MLGFFWFSFLVTSLYHLRTLNIYQYVYDKVVPLFTYHKGGFFVKLPNTNTQDSLDEFEGTLYLHNQCIQLKILKTSNSLKPFGALVPVDANMHTLSSKEHMFNRNFCHHLCICTVYSALVDKSNHSPTTLETSCHFS